MANNKIYDEYGSLMLFSKASKKDIDLLMTLICRGQNQYLQLLREVVKDDISLIKLFDVMSGQKVVFPERRKIYKTLEKVFIYNYCKSRNFSEDSYIFMAKQYNKRIPQTRAIVNTMKRFIESGSNEGFEKEDFEGDNYEQEDEGVLQEETKK